MNKILSLCLTKYHIHGILKSPTIYKSTCDMKSQLSHYKKAIISFTNLLHFHFVSCLTTVNCWAHKSPSEATVVLPTSLRIVVRSMRYCSTASHRFENHYNNQSIRPPVWTSINTAFASTYINISKRRANYFEKPEKLTCSVLMLMISADIFS